MYAYVGNDPINFVDPSGLAKASARNTASSRYSMISSGNSPLNTIISAGNNQPRMVEANPRNLLILGTMAAQAGKYTGRYLAKGVNKLKSFFGQGRGLSTSDMISAGRQLDKNGLTKAGRALQKHGDRANSAFPKSTGNAAARNRQGQDVLEGILKSGNKNTKPNRFGGKDIFDKNTGRGVRFDEKGTMRGFLEP